MQYISTFFAFALAFPVLNVFLQQLASLIAGYARPTIDECFALFNEHVRIAKKNPAIRKHGAWVEFKLCQELFLIEPGLFSHCFYLLI